MKKSFLSILVLLLFNFSIAQSNSLNLLIGTYTKNCDSKGIYVYEFDTVTGNFVFKNATKIKTDNPSYITISGDNKFVYSANENGLESYVSTFSFNSINGNLDFVNKQKTNSPGPCYIINDSKNVITANYSGGNITVFNKNNDGSITAQKQLVQHYGKGVNLKRQEKPHAHMVQFSPDHKNVFATDLGTDKLYSYQYNSKDSSKPLQIKDSVLVKSGSGPRHFTFSKDGKKLYLLQELDGTVSVFNYAKGKLKLVQKTTVLNDGFNKTFTAADIHISPDERFLYATNRGEANDISCFKIQKDGKLTFVDRTSTLGNGPRNFTIDPSGNFLLVGHQYSNNVVIFKRDKSTGKLTDTGKMIELCSTVCLVFTKI